MNLASQLFFAMLIASLSGSAAYSIWRFFLNALYDREPALRYRMLRMACMFYILPIGYLMAQTLMRGGYTRIDAVWQANFDMNRLTIWAVILPGTAWIVLAVRHAVKLFVEGRDRRLEIRLMSEPEENQEVIEEFLRIKKKFHIRRKILLYRNDVLKSPMITGIFRVRIYLPDRHYTKRQLAVIFSHELTHYRSHDVFYRICGTYVDTAQCISPCAKELNWHLCEWSECECDRKATDAMRDEFTVGEYFQSILDITEQKKETSDGNEAFAMLFESQLGLERRIEYMKKFANWKQVRRLLSAAMTVAFVMLSISTTYAAGAGLAMAYDFLECQTREYAVEMTEVPDASVEPGEIHFLPAEEAHTYDECVFANPELETISPLLNENELVTFNWSMPPKQRTRSGQYWFYRTYKISISCTSVPLNQTYWVGIEDEKGNVWYTEAQGNALFQMRIPADGNYRVIVENHGSSNITAGGSYYYYELHKA